MDAESNNVSLSQGLLGGPSTSQRKTLKACAWVCALGLVVVISATVLGISTRSTTLHGTSVFLADAPDAAAEKLENLTVADDPAAIAAAKAAKLKKVIKEGGKRGVEIEGASDLGGTSYFCSVVDEPEGDVDLLLESVKAMNQKCEPGTEERKGCSGHVGKMVFSMNDDQVALVAYVPEEKYEELSCQDWLQGVLNLYNETSRALTTGQNFSTGVIVKDTEKGIYPIKIRDNLVRNALDFLRERKLFPEAGGDDDSSDEFVMGDDYVPPDDM